MTAPLDRFIPKPDAGGRHETLVHAPAHLVFEVACHIDLDSIFLIRAIFWLRGKLLRAKASAGPGTKFLGVETLVAMGWGVLEEQKDRLFMAGASCQPWEADVVFTPLAPEIFAAYAEPHRVKIAWTIEVEPLGAELSRFATETRAVGTDEQARARFRRYWMMFAPGIIMIRLLLVPAVRRQAEREWRLRQRRAIPD